MYTQKKTLPTLLLESGELKVIVTEQLVDGKNCFENRKEFIFPLQEITKTELFGKRLSGKPGFVFKADGKYLYAQIPKEFNFVHAELLPGAQHQCSCHPGKTCSRMSAASDEDGGCHKVRDLSVDTTRGITPQKLKPAKRIEKYPFILKGYETFNTDYESFGVLECSNYIGVTQTSTLSELEPEQEPEPELKQES